MRHVYSQEMNALTRWLEQKELRFRYWSNLCRDQEVFVESVRNYFEDLDLPELDLWYNVLLPIFKLVGLHHTTALPALDLTHAEPGYRIRMQMLQANPGLVSFIGLMINTKEWILAPYRSTVQFRVFVLLGWLDQYLGDVPSALTHDVAILYP